eukprot:CAMPEP_0117569136 /NCGR_PEP_ID=MMETSP0784-20121206/58501_2 /TAXON_ID=39447 /ORGANISM="" /LENGTH=305 /DNA_ID=CAMNT_0005367097 /DNA_START=45 /DNA_END=960 /DNA_ORIENTATION=-
MKSWQMDDAGRLVPTEHFVAAPSWPERAFRNPVAIEEEAARCVQRPIRVRRPSRKPFMQPALVVRHLVEASGGEQLLECCDSAHPSACAGESARRLRGELRPDTGVGRTILWRRPHPLRARGNYGHPEFSEALQSLLGAAHDEYIIHVQEQRNRVAWHQLERLAVMGEAAAPKLVGLPGLSRNELPSEVSATVREQDAIPLGPQARLQEMHLLIASVAVAKHDVDARVGGVATAAGTSKRRMALERREIPRRDPKWTGVASPVCPRMDSHAFGLTTPSPQAKKAGSNQIVMDACMVQGSSPDRRG